MMTDRDGANDGLTLSSPGGCCDADVIDRLRTELAVMPDVAFAHLATVAAEGSRSAPAPTLFVWLRPESLRSLRMALNLVSEGVARALPHDVFVDVAILNSAPELLARLETSGILLVELDPAERRRALEASTAESVDSLAPRTDRPWWWPF